MDAILSIDPFHGRDGRGFGGATGKKSFLVFDRRGTAVQKECEGVGLSTQLSSLLQDEPRVYGVFAGNASRENPLRTTV